MSHTPQNRLGTDPSGEALHFPVLTNRGIPEALRALPVDLIDLSWAVAYTGLKVAELRRMASEGRFPEVWAMSNTTLKVSANAFREWVDSRRLSPEATRAAEVKGYRQGGPGAV